MAGFAHGNDAHSEENGGDGVEGGVVDEFAPAGEGDVIVVLGGDFTAGGVEGDEMLGLGFGGRVGDVGVGEGADFG